MPRISSLNFVFYMIRLGLKIGSDIVDTEEACVRLLPQWRALFKLT